MLYPSSCKLSPNSAPWWIDTRFHQSPTSDTNRLPSTYLLPPALPVSTEFYRTINSDMLIIDSRLAKSRHIALLRDNPMAPVVTRSNKWSITQGRDRGRGTVRNVNATFIIASGSRVATIYIPCDFIQI